VAVAVVRVDPAQPPRHPRHTGYSPRYTLRTAGLCGPRPACRPPAPARARTVTGSGFAKMCPCVSMIRIVEIRDKVGDRDHQWLFRPSTCRRWSLEQQELARPLADGHSDMRVAIRRIFPAPCAAHVRLLHNRCCPRVRTSNAHHGLNHCRLCCWCSAPRVAISRRGENP